MADAQRSQRLARLRAATSRYLRQREVRAASLVRTVSESGWVAYLFGGVPRGLDRQGPSYVARDLDLVFRDDHFEAFQRSFSRSVVRQTRFGGVHLNVEGLEIDAWPLSSTWAFRERHVLYASFESLPKTTFLNADGIVVEFGPRPGHPRRIYRDGLDKLEDSQELEIELEANPFPALCVVRSLKLSSDWQIPMGARLVEYCLKTMATLPLEAFLEVQTRHYGSVYFDATRLAGLARGMDQHLSQHPTGGFPVRLQQEFWATRRSFAGCVALHPRSMQRQEMRTS